MRESPWRQSWRADPHLAAMADRHYPRQNRDALGADQFVPPGTCLVLKTFDGSAGWVTSWPRMRRDRWGGTWINSFFRNEGDMLSSELITLAVAHTRFFWPTPAQGMITFIDAASIKSPNPGYCYKCAGFELVGETAIHHRLVLQLRPRSMPDPLSWPGRQLSLDEMLA